MAVSLSPAERKRQRLTQRLRYVGVDVFEVAFDGAAEVVRSDYPDVPHEDDPHDYCAGCQASLQDAAEKRVTTAGFDGSDPQVWDQVLDAVQHVQDLSSSAALAGTPFDSDPRENWASYWALYGESQHHAAEVPPPSLGVRVEHHHRPRSNCGGRRRPGTRRVRRTSGSRGDPSESAEPGEKPRPRHPLHVDDHPQAGVTA